jgi:hypothetical protein
MRAFDEDMKETLHGIPTESAVNAEQNSRTPFFSYEVALFFPFVRKLRRGPRCTTSGPTKGPRAQIPSQDVDFYKLSDVLTEMDSFKRALSLSVIYTSIEQPLR